MASSPFAIGGTAYPGSVYPPTVGATSAAYSASPPAREYSSAGGAAALGYPAAYPAAAAVLPEGATPLAQANQPFATHAGKNVQQPALPRPARSLLAAPLLVFVTTSIGCACFWQLAPLPAAIAVLVLLVALPVSMPAAHIRAGAVAAGALLPVGICLLALVMGALTGIYAYEVHMRSFYSISLGRAYDNVLASTPGAAYADAGKLRFADSSDLQVQLALGYRSAPTYCVAPIMDTGGGQQARMITFWAVGVDCCAARGSFTCAKKNVKGGVRANLDGIFVQSHQEFQKAIEQAAAVGALVVDENPILVQWVEDPGSEQRKQLLGAVFVLGFGAALFSLVACGAYVVNLWQS